MGQLDERLEKTKRNVAKALSNESLAVQRYLFYAERARSEGDADAARLFENMARNEQQHARQFLKLLEGERDTIENLRVAAQAENGEWKYLYPSFAGDAREEGQESVAWLFERIGAIESSHEKRFVGALLARSGPQEAEAIQGEKPPCGGRTETRPQYTCMFCGHGEKDFLQECPVCHAAGAFEETAAACV